MKVLAARMSDATHQTPAQVFVYLHGCGGASGSDVYAASNIDADWIGLAPGGAEGLCWDDQSASAKIVMDAIAGLKTHFNVDRRRVHIGGYSSGGDQSYYTALRNASSFAGILSYNSIPAYTAKGLQDGIAEADWKLNIVHLSQTEDGVYAIADVRARFQALRDAGFPVTHIERPGLHYDDNTTEYRNTLVYPHLRDGWRAP
jgi:predicted esterase